MRLPSYISDILGITFTMVVPRFVLNNPLFKGIDASKVTMLLKLSNERIFPDRAIILQRFERGNDLHIVMEGQVEVKTAHGETLVILGPGSVLGEVSLVDDQPRSASVLAKGECRVAAINEKELHGLLAGDVELKAQIMENLARILSGRLRAANAHMDVSRSDS